MNALQTAYSVALAQVEAIRAEIKAAHPMPVTDDDAVFEAWLDATEAAEIRLNLGAAESVLATAEDALVRWSFSVAMAQALVSGVPSTVAAVDAVAAKWPKLSAPQRGRLVELAFHLDA